jgi:hypothetical protein
MSRPSQTVPKSKEKETIKIEMSEEDKDMTDDDKEKHKEEEEGPSRNLRKRESQPVMSQSNEAAEKDPSWSQSDISKKSKRKGVATSSTAKKSNKSTKKKNKDEDVVVSNSKYSDEEISGILDEIDDKEHEKEEVTNKLSQNEEQVDVEDSKDIVPNEQARSPDSKETVVETEEENVVDSTIADNKMDQER